MTDVVRKNIDLSNEFNDINGCAVLYNSKNREYSLYNSDMCDQEVSPYSTFKIISTLAGLHSGIIKDETSKMNYKGEQYAVTGWNDNLELNEISYGNCDVSEWKWK